MMLYMTVSIDRDAEMPFLVIKDEKGRGRFSLKRWPHLN